MTCQQKGCTKEATHEVFWPGQLTKQCEEHAKNVQAAGRALFGLTVEIRPLQNDIPPSLHEK